jgi:hypothetical protein
MFIRYFAISHLKSELWQTMKGCRALEADEKAISPGFALSRAAAADDQLINSPPTADQYHAEGREATREPPTKSARSASFLLGMATSGLLTLV